MKKLENQTFQSRQINMLDRQDEFREEKKRETTTITTAQQLHSIQGIGERKQL